MNKLHPGTKNLIPNKPMGKKALGRKALAIKMEQGYYEKYMSLCPKTRGSLVRQAVQEAIADKLAEKAND